MSTVRHASARRSASRTTARTAILAVVVTALIVAALFPLRSLLAQHSQLKDLNHQVSVLETENRQLERRIHQWHDPEYIEKVARECLGMVKPGEVPFVVVPKGGAPKPVSC
jgi:cell division protein FtsB